MLEDMLWYNVNAKRSCMMRSVVKMRGAIM